MEIKEDEEEEVGGSRSLIYICMKVYEADSRTCKDDWYVFDRNNNLKKFYKEDELSKLYFHGGFRCAVLGEEIYVICCKESLDGPVSTSGGYNRCSKEVKIYHTGKREWRNGEPMLIARSNPAVAALQGKIYVFGTNDFYIQPWAEFYDPSSKKWYPIPNSPSRSDLIMCYVSDYTVISQTQVLLWTASCFMIMFDAHDETWTFLQSDDFRDHYRMGNSFFHPVVATKHNVLYWFYGDSLFAYDLANNESLSSSHGRPIFTFDNIWDGPGFLYSKWCYMFIDTIGKKNMKDELCLIWYDLEADSVIYTSFELSEQEVDYEKGDSSKGVRWCGRYHSLEFSKTKQKEYFDPLYLDHEIKCLNCYLITHCLPVVKSSSSKDVGIEEPPRQGSYSPHRRQHCDLHNVFDTMFKQMGSCCAERGMRAEELRGEVLQRVENQQQDEECNNMSMEEFLHKHEIQELSDVFKAKNISLDDLKRAGELSRLDNFKFPRILRIKLAMALGWSRDIPDFDGWAPYYDSSDE